MTAMTAAIAPARFPRDADTVRRLFRDYIDGLGLDLGFQGGEAELAALPGKYAPPAGTVLLARDGHGRAIGVVAMWQLSPGTAEIKRLFIRPGAQGRGLGRRLVAAIIAAARAAGYARMRLDTQADMTAALALYHAVGFRPVANYNANPLPGARHFELVL